MEKRTLLAIVLSMAILFVWGIVFDQTKIKGTPQPKQKTVTVTPSQPAKPMDVASPAATPQSNIKSASSVVVETSLIYSHIHHKRRRARLSEIEKILNHHG